MVKYEHKYGVLIDFYALFSIVLTNVTDVSCVASSCAVWPPLPKDPSDPVNCNDHLIWRHDLI